MSCCVPNIVGDGLPDDGRPESDCGEGIPRIPLADSQAFPEPQAASAGCEQTKRIGAIINVVVAAVMIAAVDQCLQVKQYVASVDRKGTRIAGSDSFNGAQ